MAVAACAKSFNGIHPMGAIGPVVTRDRYTKVINYNIAHLFKCKSCGEYFACGGRPDSFYDAPPIDYYVTHGAITSILSISGASSSIEINSDLLNYTRASTLPGYSFK